MEAVSAMVATQAVEAFREEHGRLPRSLEEAGLSDDLLEYELRGDGYTLRASGAAGPAAGQDPLASLRELGVDPEILRRDP